MLLQSIREEGASTELARHETVFIDARGAAAAPHLLRAQPLFVLLATPLVDVENIHDELVIAS